MKFTDLPNDLFMLIIELLSPKDLILSRRVSKDFYAAFTNPDLNHHFLVRQFPHAREVRALEESNGQDLAQLFYKIAFRYHCLASGNPVSLERFALAKSLVVPSWAKYYPVAPWKRYLEYEGRTARFSYPDTLWTCDDGLLIFPSAELQHYTLYSIASKSFSLIDLESETKIIRRIRLQERILVVEWCEKESYHQLNENERVYRHFATAYDVVQESATEKWKVTFRNEWKIHFLGMPLNSRDRFVSVHNATHYALYLWQPNRSAWGEDEPIEALIVWDISSPSIYRPSEDPTQKRKPAEGLEGPRVARRLSFADLDFYQVRQWATPVLTRLELDANHVYMIEEKHKWMVGYQVSYTFSGQHEVKSTGIPFGAGPRWEDRCDRDGAGCRVSRGEIWNNRSPNIAPCWRHIEFPSITIAESVDIGARLAFTARNRYMLETVSIRMEPEPHPGAPVREVLLGDDQWQELLNKGKVCGDERWLVGEDEKGEIVILHFDPVVKNEGSASL